MDPTTVSTLSMVQERDSEYATLDKLRGGMALAYFEQVLGAPMFVTRGREGSVTESLFRGKDYWLQAVSDDAGAVQLMAVTACTPEFHPSYTAVEGSPPLLGPIVLNETHLDQTGEKPSNLRYFTGVTADRYYLDEYSFGNPGNYKTYFVGINDACGVQPDNLPPSFYGPTDYNNRKFDSSDAAVAGFRASSVVNTYAETGTVFDPTVLKSFHVGASRILTRTAPPLPSG